jgi:hypothetical protein
MARRSIIRVSDIERRLGTVYTVDTLARWSGATPGTASSG